MISTTQGYCQGLDVVCESHINAWHIGNKDYLLAAIIIIVMGERKGTELNNNKPGPVPNVLHALIHLFLATVLQRKICPFITEKTEAQGRVTSNFLKVKKLMGGGIKDMNSGMPNIKVHSFAKMYDCVLIFPNISPSLKKKPKECKYKITK